MNSDYFVQDFFMKRVWKLIHLKHPLFLIKILKQLLMNKKETLLQLLTNKNELINEIDSIKKNIGDNWSDTDSDDNWSDKEC